MSTVPTVSVIMPVYNAEHYLRLAVESVLNQTWTDFELIAVDDGSSDSSKRILEDFARTDSRVIVISRQNTGIVGALNDGIAAARGEFLARMDADDECRPTRFAKQVSRLRSEPELVALGSAVTFMDSRGNSVKACPRALTHREIEGALLSGDGGALIHPAVTFRAAAVRQVGGYQRAAQYVEDLDLFLRLARIGSLGNLADNLLRYRVHPQSINFTKNAGRYQVKLAVLAAAYAARGQSFDAARFHDDSTAHADPAAHHREWAITCLSYGSRRVAIYHGWRAVRLAPGSRASWRALAYALKGPPLSS